MSHNTDRDDCCGGGCGCGDDHDSHGSSAGFDCCSDHHMSKEHLQAKKQRLEEKLAKINEQLSKE